MKEVLETVEFPTSKDSGWVRSEGDMKLWIGEDYLKRDDIHSVSLFAKVEMDATNPKVYTYSDWVKFNLDDDGKLESIVFDSSSNTSINGTYTAPTAE